MKDVVCWFLELWADCPEADRARILDDLQRAAGRSPGESALTIRQAAKRIGCSPRLVYKMYHAGELAGYSVRAKKLIFAKSVDKYVADHANRPRPPVPARRKVKQPARTFEFYPPT
jgi:excisionase family DNA binding protein